MRKILILGASFAFALAGFSSAVVAADDPPPTPEEEAFAVQTTDKLQDQVLALLLKEFENTTEENFEAGNKAISLAFNDFHRYFRLVGELEPIGETSEPQDVFETDALAGALSGLGVESLEVCNGKYYFRRSLALQNNDASCAICHQNYASPPDDAYVGALMFRVPVREAARRDRRVRCREDNG